MISLTNDPFRLRSILIVVMLATLPWLSGCRVSKEDPQKVGFVLKACEFSASYSKQDVRYIDSSTTIGSFCSKGLETAAFLALMQAAFEVPKNRDAIRELRPLANRMSEIRGITMLELGEWLEANANDDQAFRRFQDAAEQTD